MLRQVAATAFSSFALRVSNGCVVRSWGLAAPGSNTAIYVFVHSLTVALLARFSFTSIIFTGSRLQSPAVAWAAARYRCISCVVTPFVSVT